MNIKTKSESLKSIAQKSDYSKLETTIRSLVDAVAMFENHCNVLILKDALADWYNGLEIKQIPCKCMCVCVCGVCPFLHPSIYPSLHPTIHLPSIHSSIYPFICLLIYNYIYEMFIHHTILIHVFTN